MPRIPVLIIKASPTPDTLQALSGLPDCVDLRWVDKSRPVADQLADIEVTYGDVTPSELPSAPQLKWVQSQSTGVDAMIYPAFQQSDILLTSLGGAITTVVAEHTVALLLAIARNLHLQRDAMTQQPWKMFCGVELLGMTVGIAGLGRIGRAVLQRLVGFEMQFLALDPKPTVVPDEIERVYSMAELPEFLGQLDALITCIPSTPETRPLLGPAQFAMMKPGSFLVNTSRGDVLDQEALLECLRSGHLRAAGLDVCAPEPLPADHPLWSEPNLLLTPHAAGWSQHLMRRKMRWFADNLKRYVAGEELLGVVDKRLGW